MIVVHGKKMMPSIGQIHQRSPAKLRKAASQRSGWKSHHYAPNIRGPRMTRVYKAQHMVLSPLNLFPQFVKLNMIIGGQHGRYGFLGRLLLVFQPVYTGPIICSN
jgi:hypothetical protein